MLNTQWARRKAILYFTELYVATPALAVTVESLVMDILYTVSIRIRVFAQRSKGTY